MARRKIDRNAPFQSISGAAYMTGLSAGYIRTGCKAGTVPHIRVGTDYRVNMPRLLEQLNAQSVAGRATDGHW